MSELRTRIERLGGPVETASEDAIVADLARGHRAVRRRRTAQAAAGSAFGVAAIVAAFSFAATGAGQPVSPGAAPAPAVSSAVAAGGLKLVDYRGTQPRWFTVDTVPEGFFIQHDYYGGLTIAPEAARTRPPGIKPSTPAGDLYDPQILTGKIAVFLESKEYRGELSGDQVTVAGKQAVLHPLGGGSQQLIIAVDPKVYATVQVDVPLSREQVLKLGAGLHVHQDAVDRMSAGVVPKKIKK